MFAVIFFSVSIYECNFQIIKPLWSNSVIESDCAIIVYNKESIIIT